MLVLEHAVRSKRRRSMATWVGLVTSSRLHCEEDFWHDTSIPSPAAAEIGAKQHTTSNLYTLQTKPTSCVWMQARAERLDLAIAVTDADIAAMHAPIAASAPIHSQRISSLERGAGTSTAAHTEPEHHPRYDPTTRATPVDGGLFKPAASGPAALLQQTTLTDGAPRHTSTAATSAAGATRSAAAAAAHSVAHVELEASRGVAPGSEVPLPHARADPHASEHGARISLESQGGALLEGAREVGEAGVGTLGARMQSDMVEVRAFLAQLPGPQVRTSVPQHQSHSMCIV